MTLKQLSYNILNIISGGRASDDYLPSLRQIEFWIFQYRELLVKQQDDKDRTLDSILLQDLGCVPMKLVDAAECCEVTLCDRVLRTENPIPQPISLSYNEALTYVGTVDFRDPFQKITTTHIPFSGYDKYIGKLKKWYYKGGHIYVLNDVFIDYIKVVGVFFNPKEVADYTHCGSSAVCYDDNTQFPIAGYMVPTITQMILEKELGIMYKVNDDTTNDAQHQ